MNIELIKPVYEEPGYKGGVQDYGNFSEGYCFKVETLHSTIWIVCCDDSGQKEKLMSNLKKLKLFKQRDKGQIIVNKHHDNDTETVQHILNIHKNPEGTYLDKRNFVVNTKKPTDGYWIVLQEWSQCSKKCDGGVSTFHRMCIEPKNGGKPCEGQSVLTSPCNTQPCPHVHQRGVHNGQKPVTLKPIVKVLPYSNRPQSYHKCIIKESDLMLVKVSDVTAQVEKPKHSQLVPSRVVMNNRTISIYENADDYSSHFATFDLKTTDFFRSSSEKECFILSQGKKKVQLCPFGFDKSSKTFEEWDKDFHLFKYSCETKPDEINLEMNNKLSEKIKEAKDEMLLDREAIVKQKMREKEEDNSYSIIKKTNKVAQEAILKESGVEEMIEKEELDREKKSEAEILEQIEKEKKRNVLEILSLGLHHACD